MFPILRSIPYDVICRPIVSTPDRRATKERRDHQARESGMLSQPSTGPTNRAGRGDVPFARFEAPVPGARRRGFFGAGGAVARGEGLGMIKPSRAEPSRPACGKAPARLPGGDGGPAPNRARVSVRLLASEGGHRRDAPPRARGARGEPLSRRSLRPGAAAAVHLGAIPLGRRIIESYCISEHGCHFLCTGGGMWRLQEGEDMSY